MSNVSMPNVSMPNADLYTLLRKFSARTKSSFVDVVKFSEFFEAYVQKLPSGHEWARWANNTSTLFFEELASLTDSGKCMLISGGKGRRIFLPSYCSDRIEEAYRNIEKLAEFPFQNERALKLVMPKGFARSVNLNTTDMRIFFEDRENADPNEIISLQFPRDLGNAILLASMIPRKLIEICLEKMRYYLNNQSVIEYLHSRMNAMMKGSKDQVPKDIIGMILTNPQECFYGIEASMDSHYSFWTLFCPLVKSDIEKKINLHDEDTAAMQAACIIEVCCVLYRIKNEKKQELDSAYEMLEAQMDRAPWYYSMGDIIGFTNKKNIQLIKIYTTRGLENYIKNATSGGAGGYLSAWLVIQGDKKNEQWFIKKERYLHHCARMIFETQPFIKTAVIKRWTALIEEHKSETAMESDDEFEKLLKTLVKNIKPNLRTVFDDPRLALAYLEFGHEVDSTTQASRIFKDGVMLPHRVIFDLNRSELVSDIKSQFPFWYSVPFIVSIVLFFRKLFPSKNKTRNADAGDAGGDNAAETASGGELRTSARSIESDIVPYGKTIDDHLAHLQKKWVHILDKKAAETLITDVHALLRDNLKSAFKTYKLRRVTREALREIAQALAWHNPALKKMADQNSLLLYMELYMVKLLLTEPLSRLGYEGTD